jgi:hypothetical protein
MPGSISVHIRMSFEAICLIPVNFFAFSSLTNLLCNLLFSKELFQAFMESHFPPYVESRMTTIIWNLIENMSDLFLLSANLSLFGSSVVGIIFVSDQISVIFFYLYLILIGLFTIIKCA